MGRGVRIYTRTGFASRSAWIIAFVVRLACLRRSGLKALRKGFGRFGPDGGVLLGLPCGIIGRSVRRLAQPAALVGFAFLRWAKCFCATRSTRFPCSRSDRASDGVNVRVPEEGAGLSFAEVLDGWGDAMTIEYSIDLPGGKPLPQFLDGFGPDGQVLGVGFAASGWSVRQRRRRHDPAAVRLDVMAQPRERAARANHVVNQDVLLPLADRSIKERRAHQAFSARGARVPHNVGLNDAGIDLQATNLTNQPRVSSGKCVRSSILHGVGRGDDSIGVSCGKILDRRQIDKCTNHARGGLCISRFGGRVIRVLA